MNNEQIIEVSQVRRSYSTDIGFFRKTKKQIEALKGISFSVNKGEIFGLLGPNGAGKTTMIKILTTMLIPDSGKVSVLGMDPVSQHKQLRPHINFILGGERNLYWRLSAYDNLAYFADLYQVPRPLQKKRINDLLELVGLDQAAHQKVETFSKGMKQRLQIARGLTNQPRLLLLDEPSIGLDPVSARQLRDILLQLNREGTTILLTTHYMYEADELCDRIAFIRQGQLAAIDTPQKLKEQTNSVSVISCKIVGAKPQDIDSLSSLSGIRHIQAEQADYTALLRIHTEKPQQVIPLLYQILGESAITDLGVAKPTLEDVYVHIMEGQSS